MSLYDNFNQWDFVDGVGDYITMPTKGVSEEDVQNVVDKAFENINASLKTDDQELSLSINNSVVSTVTIEDKYLQNAAFSDETQELVFTVSNGEQLKIDLSRLLDEYSTDQEVDDKLEAKADSDNVYTKEEADGKFLTEHQDVSMFVTESFVETKVTEVEDDLNQTETDLTEKIETAVADMATMTWVEEKNYLTEHQDLTDYGTKEEITSLKSELTEYINALLKNYQFKADNDIAKSMNGNDIVVAKDIKSDSGYTLTKPTNIDLNGHSLDAVSNGNYGDNIVVGNGATVTISNGEIKPADNASVSNASATIIIKTASESHLTLNDVKVTGIHPVYLNSANENTTVTINGGEFYTTMPLEGVDSDHMAPAVYVGKGSTGSTIGGKVTINGGTFGCKGVVNNFLLNVEDVLRKQEGKEPRDFIECFGGNFYNFNPSDNKSEGEGTSFVAQGYHVESEQDGDDVLYKVVKDEECADN